MAEAVAAFSLAANIIQFIDFSSRVVTNFWRIYADTGAAANDIPDLNKINRDLQQILINLEDGTNNSEVKELGFVELTRACRVAAIELDTKLKPLVKARSEARGKRHAFKAALKLIWNEKDIQYLQDRLGAFRHQLTLHLLSSLRELAYESAAQQREILSEISKLGTKSSISREHTIPHVRTDSETLAPRISDPETLAPQITDPHSKTSEINDSESLATHILGFVTSKLDLSIQLESKSQLKHELINAIHRDNTGSRSRVASFDIAKPQFKKLGDRVIESLSYHGMEDREERIAQAYGATFEWIFKDQSDKQVKWYSFKEFLKSDDRLYWITGKAGSGKSTLMKYVCCRGNNSDPPSLTTQAPSRCFEYLKEWAKDWRVVTATFFFWNSGMPLQMKQEGLFRTLLVQLLGQLPDLIPLVTPKRWEALYILDDDPLDWSDQELQQMLRDVIPNLGDSTKICLFVDGLDEFEGGHGELVMFFKELIADSRVKLCVSSRPWVVFEDAFEHAPSLMLQYLTFNDIKHYVFSHMVNDSRFELLRKREPVYANELVENIVTKSSGVFLWVRIVVQSILSGMGYGDRISDLQSRLDILPAELEQLYDKIFNSLDPFYLEHAAQLFKFVRASPSPPSVLLLSFADEDDNWRKAIARPLAPLATEEAEILQETMSRRINSRCKGFLEIQRTLPANTRPNDVGSFDLCTVQYLHRTVKDYVESPDVQKKLESAMKRPYDPHLSHCAGWLAMIRTRPVVLELVDRHNRIWIQINLFLHHASRVLQGQNLPLIELMDALDKSCTAIAEQSATKLKEYGGRLIGEEKFLELGEWAALHPYRQNSRPSGGHYLSLVVRNGILPYVQRRVSPGCLVPASPLQVSAGYDDRSTSYPLLLDAVKGLIFRPKASDIEPQIPNLAMIKYLLQSGADSNYKIPHFSLGYNAGQQQTVWEVVLNDFKKVLWDPSQPLSSQTAWTSVCKHMVESGAGGYSASERKNAVNSLNSMLELLEIEQDGYKVRDIVWENLSSKSMHARLPWTMGFFLAK